MNSSFEPPSRLSQLADSSDFPFEAYLYRGGWSTIKMIFQVVLVAAFWSHTMAYDLASRSNRVRFPNHEPPPFLITADNVYEAAASQDAPSVSTVKNYQNAQQHFPALHHQSVHSNPPGQGGPGSFPGPQLNGPQRPHVFHQFSSHPPRPDNQPIKSPFHESQSHQSTVNSPTNQIYLKTPDRYALPGLAQNLPPSGKQIPQKQLFKPANYRQNPPPYRDESRRPGYSGRGDDASDYSSFENFSGPSSSSFEHFGPPRGPPGNGGGPGVRPRPQPPRSPDYFKNRPSRLQGSPTPGSQYDFPSKFGGSQEFNGPPAATLEDSSEEFPEFDRLRSKWKLTFNEPQSDTFVKKKRPPQTVQETKQHYFKQGFKSGSFSNEDDSSDFDYHSGPSSLHSSHRNENFFASSLRGGVKRKEKPSHLNDYFDFPDMSDFSSFKSSSPDNFKFGSFDFSDFSGKKKKQSLGLPFSGSEWVPINVPQGGEESSLKSYDIPSIESVAKEFNFPSSEVGEGEFTRNVEFQRPVRNRVTTGSNIVYGGRKQSNGGNEEVVSASLTVKQ